jgi:hypothetical protein
MGGVTNPVDSRISLYGGMSGINKYYFIPEILSILGDVIGP